LDAEAFPATVDSLSAGSLKTRRNHPVPSRLAGLIKLRQSTQRSQAKIRDVLGEKLQVKRAKGFPTDQSLGAGTSHPIVKALPDDTERQSVSLTLVGIRTKAPNDLLQSLELGANHFSNQDVGGGGRMEQLPCDQAVPPVFGVVERQDMLEKVMNKEVELFTWPRIGIEVAGTWIKTATMSMQDGLDIELTLVTEVIIDGGDVRTCPFANRANPRRIEPLAGKLFASRFEQANSGRILNIHEIPYDRKKSKNPLGRARLTERCANTETFRGGHGGPP
jgi:hypothetical protein